MSIWLILALLLIAITFTLEDCEEWCCAGESECAGCNDPLPESVTVTVINVANNTPASRVNCCDGGSVNSADCTNCTALNTSYVLDRDDGDCIFGCCCWTSSFVGPIPCDQCVAPATTPDEECRAVAAKLEVCVSGTDVSVRFMILTPGSGLGFNALWTYVGAHNGDCLAALSNALNNAFSSPCDYSGSTASVSF